MRPPPPELNPGPVLSPWDLLPFLGAAALLRLCQTLWNRLPDPLPSHFGLDGRPNGWTPKGVAPWIMFGFPAVIWVLLVALGTWTVPKDLERAALQRRIMAPMRGLTVLALIVLLSLVVTIPIHGQTVFWPTFGIFFGLLFLGLGLMVGMGYRHAPADVKQLWKWGVFYLNPEDPRLWVPKRFGIGWTLNFARRIAWAVMGLLLMVPLIPLAIILLTSH